MAGFKADESSCSCRSMNFGSGSGLIRKKIVGSWAAQGPA